MLLTHLEVLGLKLPLSTQRLRYRSSQLWLPALHHTILLFGHLTFLWALDGLSYKPPQHVKKSKYIQCLEKVFTPLGIFHVLLPFHLQNMPTNLKMYHFFYCEVNNKQDKITGNFRALSWQICCGTMFFPFEDDGFDGGPGDYQGFGYFFITQP